MKMKPGLLTNWKLEVNSKLIIRRKLDMQKVAEFLVKDHPDLLKLQPKDVKKHKK